MEKKSNLIVSLEELFTKQETAGLLKKSTGTIDRYRKQGILTSISVGGSVMFKRSEINRFIEEAGV